MFLTEWQWFGFVLIRVIILHTKLLGSSHENDISSVIIALYQSFDFIADKFWKINTNTIDFRCSCRIECGWQINFGRCLKIEYKTKQDRENLLLLWNVLLIGSQSQIYSGLVFCYIPISLNHNRSSISEKQRSFLYPVYQ